SPRPAVRKLALGLAGGSRVDPFAAALHLNFAGARKDAGVEIQPHALLKDQIAVEDAAVKLIDRAAARIAGARSHDRHGALFDVQVARRRADGAELRLEPDAQVSRTRLHE